MSSVAATTPGWRLLLRGTARVATVELLAYARTWKGSVFSSFVEPLLYLLALGVGLGSLVDRGAGQATVDFDYVTYLAPALLVAAAMRTAASESTWPVMAGIKWRGTFDAALATPVRVADLVSGLLTWALVRVVMSGIAFGLVATALGAVDAAALPGLLVTALAVGSATAAPLLAYTASVRDAPALSNLYRYGIVPAYLFSGTFFPLEQLPDWTASLATLVPLWHGVELSRLIALDVETAWAPGWHFAALGAWTVLGVLVALARFRRRLTP